MSFVSVLMPGLTLQTGEIAGQIGQLFKSYRIAVIGHFRFAVVAAVAALFGVMIDDSVGLDDRLGKKFYWMHARHLRKLRTNTLIRLGNVGELLAGHFMALVAFQFDKNVSS